MRKRISTTNYVPPFLYFTYLFSIGVRPLEGFSDDGLHYTIAQDVRTYVQYRLSFYHREALMHYIL